MVTSIKKNLFVILGFISFTFFMMACSSNDPVINNSVKTSGKLSVSVTASAYKGKYTPRHVMAVWVESTSGTFVKTLVAKAAERREYLTNWLKATSSGNTTDALTGATLNSYSAMSCSWDGTNVSGSVVGDGAYNLRVEYTEDNSTGKIASFPFTKGATVDVQTPAAASGVTVGELTWTPN